MKEKLLLVIGLLAVCSIGAQPAVAKKQFHLYLLVGQSNMAGRGVVEKTDTATANRVWMLNKNGEWVIAREPLHFDKPGVVGVGPGLAFGKAVSVMDTTVVIGLIPCAVGGTSIDRWAPGAYDSITASHPYDDAIKRCKTAIKTGTLKAILWQQGESDSDSLRSKMYGEKLVALVAQFRADLGKKRLPFFAGTVAEFYVAGHPFAAGINKAIEALPRKVKNAVVVSASGLSHKGDGIHFSAASARELGLRFAAAVGKFYRVKQP